MFLRGKNFKSYDVLGAHFKKINGRTGVLFTLWAPNAKEVSLVGDFNDWNTDLNPMEKHICPGIWITFVPDLPYWSSYKYAITDKVGQMELKTDPFAFHCETRPKTASKVAALAGYPWDDKERLWWENKRPIYDRPMNIYEVHLGSWKRSKDNGFLSYRELGDILPDYVSEMGYTHVELMPVMEHPFDGSWGYQITGYFAPTSRHGTPQDFMYFINRCHEKNVGVILDWVPGHFCKDGHGLYRFDGTALYEYEDPKKAYNHIWGTAYFDLGKKEIISFLISNALYWFREYHIDGIRLDAVASMLYLNYFKEEGTWTPNVYGEDGNLQAVNFLQQLNTEIFKEYPEAIVAAEESTTWPKVTAPVYMGGLGFNYKWNMGWMNDCLKYMKTGFDQKKHHHNLLTFSIMYAYSENFILPISHDEIVHGKKSLIDKMQGSYEEKFASLRMFLGYTMSHPGKKLLFMGSEFGQFKEWDYKEELDWFLLDYDLHCRTLEYVKTLNMLYESQPALWELDHDEKGFEWIDVNNRDQNVLVFYRRGKAEKNILVVICNFSQVNYEKYRIGSPIPVKYKEIINSDNEKFGGKDRVNIGSIIPQKIEWHGRPYSVEINLPPLSTIYLAAISDEGGKNRGKKSD
ncbi:MAG: 1,4-alpha-glucan branching protein GlgB [Clostridia bacterium]|nr:1,4-alpha-glucan branching protein GlgB [Clostridia bacterium]